MAFLTASGGSFTPVNPNGSRERFGSDGAGGGTQVTTGAIGNKGSWAQLSAGGANGVTTLDYAGFRIWLQKPGSSGSRVLLDIGTGPNSGAVTPIIGNIWASILTGDIFSVELPLNIASGSKIWVRIQSTAGNTIWQVHGQGVGRTSDHYPLFNTADLLVGPAYTNTAVTNTVPTSVDVTSVTSAGTGWTTMLDPTTQAYGAFVLGVGIRSSTAAPAADWAVVRLGYGAAGSEVWLGTTPFIAASSGATVHDIGLYPVFKSLPSGTRIVTEIVSASSMVLAPQVWGFR